MTGRAVAAALARRSLEVVVGDDAPGPAARALAAELGVEILDSAGVVDALSRADAYVPTPGLAEGHVTMDAARAAGVAVLSEFDLAAAWDDRPVVAITGTNGKTTVTELVADVLARSGVPAVTAGNTDVPLVEAIDDPAPDWFVVEASSFRLGYSRRFAPRVATWLNFAPDHLDVHASLATYERAKASIWRDQSSTDVAVANRDDPIVWSHANGPARVVSFGLAEPGDGGPDYGLVDGALVGPGGESIVRVDELGRSLPHDVANALAAVATAHAAGGDHRRGARRAASASAGWPTASSSIGEHDGVRWFDDSKATVPHAVGAAVRGFTSVVLIAGGRNKGLDLSVLGELAPPVRAVVGIGESADEVVDAFGCDAAPHRPLDGRRGRRGRVARDAR